MKLSIDKRARKAAEDLWENQKEATGLGILQKINSLIEEGVPRHEALAVLPTVTRRPGGVLAKVVKAARDHKSDKSVEGVLNYLKETLLPTTAGSPEATLKAARLVLSTEMRGWDLLADLDPGAKVDEDREMSLQQFKNRTGRDPVPEDYEG